MGSQGCGGRGESHHKCFVLLFVCLFACKCVCVCMRMCVQVNAMRGDKSHFCVWLPPTTRPLQIHKGEHV